MLEPIFFLGKYTDETVPFLFSKIDLIKFLGNLSFSPSLKIKKLSLYINLNIFFLFLFFLISLLMMEFWFFWFKLFKLEDWILTLDNELLGKGEDISWIFNVISPKKLEGKIFFELFDVFILS